MNILNDNQADKKQRRIPIISKAKVVGIAEWFTIAMGIGLSYVGVHQLLPSAPHPLLLEVLLWVFLVASAIILLNKICDISRLFNNSKRPK